jgi:A/G-specific adenine glycosylase
MTSQFTGKLLDWYTCNARKLPWRECSNPYIVWISEIMLQQTRVETVIPYFLKWIERFPTITTLAKASLQEVLSAWEGLGYYGRARNLHQAAQIVEHKFGGQLPSDPKALRSLPGIGGYTAGAIASMVFNLDEPVLDGNVRRVIARVFNLTEPVRSAMGERLLWKLVHDHLPPGNAGAFNQALMDLGAMICTARTPNCPGCPLVGLCKAHALGVQHKRPVKSKKSTIPHYTVTAAVIRRNRRVLIAQRPLRGLLGGLWEFPGGKVEHDEELAECLQRELREELGVDVNVGKPFGIYRHAYTHFRVTVHAFLCALSNGTVPRPIQVEDLCWSPMKKLTEYPMGKIDRQIAQRLLKS